MTTSPSRRLRPLATLHFLAMLALSVWWLVYFVEHSPAGQIFRRRAQGAPGGLGQLDSAVDAALAAALAAGPDLAMGAVVLVLLGIGTGMYVRRFEVWLQARSSGHVVSFGATGLEDQALIANAERKGMPR
jgi:hypothetical protein